MPGIVCAVRGGPASQPTISRSIRLAQETGQLLHFLYVVNLDFLSHTTSSRVHTISEQMSQMGEFILLMAQDAAARQGVEAQGVLHHGDVGKQIIDLCHGLQADYLVLGKPKVEQEDTVFTEEQLHQFAARTEEQCGARVVFSEEDTQ
jgi:nucleotide-binding universal stress UspA family protein